MQEILVLLYMRELMRSLNSYLSKFTFRKHLISVLINVLVWGSMRIHRIMRYNMNASLRPQFFLWRILNVVVLCNPSPVVREWRECT